MIIKCSSHSTVTVAPSHVFVYQQVVILVAEVTGQGMASVLPMQIWMHIDCEQGGSLSHV